MTRKVFRFDAFRLDVSAYELKRSGRPVKLQRIPMELLILLAENPGVLVTREQISSRLWPGDLIVANEQNTNTAVRKLRQALRDDAERPRYIATVTGKGYRFIADICEQAPEPVPDVARSFPVSVSGIPEPPAMVRPLDRVAAVRTLFGTAEPYWRHLDASRLQAQ